MNPEHTKWVACWGNATSITDRREAVYAKDITLRYPVRMPFDGSQLRFHFSNLTGTEPVVITNAYAAVVTSGDRLSTAITFSDSSSVKIMPGKEVTSDAIDLTVEKGDILEVSMYFADYTQMNSGTLITGPLSKGQYSYGNFAEAEELPLDLTRKTNWFYFLNTIDVLTSDKNRAVVCYGDSITAQSWPDYLAELCFTKGVASADGEVAIIRRAVSGTRILRQYDCITYQAYGLKGSTRFPIEKEVAGATDMIIQHGINDIIHPVGVEVNPFRPWSDLPTVEEMEQGVEELYMKPSKAMGLKVWAGTLLPILGWRTYNEDRNDMRVKFNEWLKTSPIFDGVMDFDKAVCDKADNRAFAEGFDSGDHLHPSEAAYKAMAQCAWEALNK